MSNHWLSTLPAMPMTSLTRGALDELREFVASLDAQCRDCGEISAEWGCRCGYIQEMREDGHD